MSAVWQGRRRKNAAPALAKPLRHHSSDEDAPKPRNALHSTHKLNGSTTLRLNASLLEVLNVTFDPQSLPLNVDADSYKEFFRRGQVFLIGVWHEDEDCVADVRRAMRRIRPDAVMVELYEYPDEGDDDDDDACEMRAALEESKKLPGCRFVLGDRDRRIIVKRAWNGIGAWEVCRVVKDISWLLLVDGRRYLTALWGSFHDDRAKQLAHDIELDRLMVNVLPEWWKAMMTERDLYMTHVLHGELELLTQERFLAARRKSSAHVQYDPQPVRIVAVVGASHIDGIKANWGKRVDAEVIEELMKSPRIKWIPQVASALVAIVVIAFTVYLAAY